MKFSKKALASLIPTMALITGCETTTFFSQPQPKTGQSSPTAQVEPPPPNPTPSPSATPSPSPSPEYHCLNTEVVPPSAEPKPLNCDWPIEGIDGALPGPMICKIEGRYHGQQVFTVKVPQGIIQYLGMNPFTAFDGLASLDSLGASFTKASVILSFSHELGSTETDASGKSWRLATLKISPALYPNGDYCLKEIRLTPDCYFSHCSCPLLDTAFGQPVPVCHPGS